MKSLSIIKIGGNVIDDESQLSAFLSAFAAIGGPRILVHGGGKMATELAGKLGVPQTLIEGRRVTSAETLNIAVMVYAGLINKKITAFLQARGCNALGLSGADGDLLRAEKRSHPQIDFGFVGDAGPEHVNTDFISLLLEKGFVPVICAVTHDAKGGLLNTNADTMASVIARALAPGYAVSLKYCFEKPGVLRDPDNDESFITSLNRRIYDELKTSGAISKGMIPKLDNAFCAHEAGVEQVLVGSAAALSGEDIFSGTLIT